MKKFYLLLLSLAFCMFMFSACNEKPSQQASGTDLGHTANAALMSSSTNRSGTTPLQNTAITLNDVAASVNANTASNDNVASQNTVIPESNLAAALVEDSSSQKEGQVIQNETMPNGTGDYVRYIELTPKNPPTIINADLKMYDENSLLNKASLIIKGKIDNKKEIALEEYKSGKLVYTYYKSIFNINIQKIFYQSNNKFKEGDSVIVSNVVCSYSLMDEAVEIEQGKEYILFLDNVEDSPTVQFSKYSDYFLIHPFQAIVSIENNQYQFDEVFKTLAKGAASKDRIIRQDKLKAYSKDKSFENDLAVLIKEKIR